MKVRMETTWTVPRQQLVTVIFPLDYEQKGVGIISDDVRERGRHFFPR